jgi:predicted nucleic acid-binding protein
VTADAAAYLDTSALVKLVVPEPERHALLAFVDERRLASSELALAELPRAVRAISARDPLADEAVLLGVADELLGRAVLLPLEVELLVAAGALPEPHLRTLDAIHVAAALAFLPSAPFVTYDGRQAAAARLSGLRTVAPGP